MNQLELFDIKKIDNTAFRSKNNKLFNKRNKRVQKTESALMIQLQPEVKKKAVIVCKQPKTTKLIPYDWDADKIDLYIKSHYDLDGRFIMNPPSDQDVFGGSASRS